MTMMQTQRIGPMVMAIQDIQGIFPIRMFSLSKGINTITSITARVSSGISLSGVENAQTPGLSDAYLKYRQNKTLMKVTIVQMDPDNNTKQKRVWLKGRITSLAPVYTAGVSSIAQLAVTCQHQIVALKASPMADYQYSVGSELASLYQIQLRKDPKNNAQNKAKDYGSSDKFTAADLQIMSSTILKKEDTVLQNTRKIISLIQALASGIEGMSAKAQNVGINITDYIKSDIYLDPAFAGHHTSQTSCPYYSELQDMLYSAISQGPIWDALIGCFTSSQRLIQFLPPSMAVAGTAQDKYLMAPKAYWPAIADAALTLNATGIQALEFTADAVIALAIPDVFSVDFSVLTQFGGGTVTLNKGQSASTYLGVYAPKNILADLKRQSTKKLAQAKLYKKKNVKAPSWLLSTIIRDRQDTGDTDKKAGQVKNDQTVTKAQEKAKAQGNKAESIIQNAKRLKQKYMDPYAKALFCAYYGVGNSGLLSLIPTEQNINVDKHIGSVVRVDLTKSGLSDSSKMSSAGVMTSYRATYMAGGEQGSSSLSVQIGLDTIRAIDDQQSISCPLYTTKKGQQPQSTAQIT